LLVRVNEQTSRQPKTAAQRSDTAWPRSQAQQAASIALVGLILRRLHCCPVPRADCAQTIGFSCLSAKLQIWLQQAGTGKIADTVATASQILSPATIQVWLFS
jgi:hypothetical protein